MPLILHATSPVKRGRSPREVQVTTLGISGAGAWTFGQAFKQGDAPDYVTIDGGQADVRNRWPDGSVKFAVLSKVSSGAETVSIVTSASNTATGNVALSSSPASLVLTGDGAGTYVCPTDSQDSDTPATWSRTTTHLMKKIAGSVMTERHYYVPTADDQLTIRFYVRSYSNEQHEVETVVENGWLSFGTPGTKSYTATLTVGGAEKFSGEVTHLRQTRWSRADLTTGTEVVPAHNTTYLRASKLVPNYVTGTPDETAFTTTTYDSSEASTKTSSNGPTPFAQGNWRATMASGGDSVTDSVGLLPHWEALYCTTADSRAYHTTIYNARGLGRYGVFYRDQVTGIAPAVDASTVVDEDVLGTPQFATSHQPAWGYLPYLLTGRWLFMEDCVHKAIHNSLCLRTNATWPTSDTPGRGGASGIFQPSANTRVNGWGFRTLAHAACIAPDGSSEQTELRRLWKNNVGYYAGLQTGTQQANNLGVLFAMAVDDWKTTGTNRSSYAPWMHAYVTMAVGMAWDLEINPDGTSSTDHQTLRDHLYKFPVGMAGLGATDFSWRRYNTYYFYVGTPNLSYSIASLISGYAPDYYASWDALYDANLTAESATHYDDTGETYIIANPVSPVAYGFATSESTMGAFLGTYAARQMAALTYALDHAATGASAARARIAASTNYVAYAASADYDTWPLYNVVPR